MIPHASGAVDFRATGGVELPFEEGQCDAVYCISVPEHIPEFGATAAKIVRALKPAGGCP